jgi:hypothetical protein
MFSTLGFAKCLASELAQQVPAGSFATSKVQRVSLTGLAATATGITVVLKIVSSKGKSTLTATVLEIRRGRALASLSVLTAGTGWSQSTLRSTAAKIATRMSTRTA